MSSVTHIQPLRPTRMEKQVRYWMRAPAITINLAAPLSAALGLMYQHDIRHLPVVVDTGELRGMISQGDICGAEVLRAAGVDLVEIARALRRIKVYEVMSADPITARPDTSLREAALAMLENKIAGLPVVDRAGGLLGIITESDLLEALAQICGVLSAAS